MPPGWLADLEAMRSALTVIKINQSPAFASWVLRERPHQRVIHIVRHPGAYLHSWSSRFLSRNDGEAVRRDNLARLRIVASANPEWGERFGDPERLSTEESELWFWLYAVETIHAAGDGSPLLPPGLRRGAGHGYAGDGPLVLRVLRPGLDASGRGRDRGPGGRVGPCRLALDLSSSPRIRPLRSGACWRAPRSRTGGRRIGSVSGIDYRI